MFHLFERQIHDTARSARLISTWRAPHVLALRIVWYQAFNPGSGAVCSYQKVCPVTAVHPLVSVEVKHRRHGMVIAAFVWSAVVLLWALMAGTVALSDHAQVIFIAVTLTSLGLIGAAAMSRDLGVRTALARLKLGPWMAIGFALGFGLATLVWLGGNIPAYRGIVTISSLGPAAVVAGVGFVALTVSYRSTPRWLVDSGQRADGRLRREGRFDAGPLGVWSLWGVAAAAQTVSFSLGNLGYLSDPSTLLNTSSSLNAVLSALAQLGLLSTLVAAWRLAVRRNLGSAFLLAWVGGSQVVLGLFSGGKEAAIIQFVALIVGYSAQGRLRLVPVVVAGLVALFVVTPFVTAYRAGVLTNSGRLTPAQALQSIDFTTLFSASAVGGGTGGTGEQLGERLARIGDVAIIVTKSPSAVPFVSPLELVGGPVLGLIPRSLWPGKPVLDAGYQANIAYYGAPPSVYSSAALTPYGDLYRHGGLVVVIVGMGALGMFVRVVDDRKGPTATVDPRMMFLPMLLFATLVKQETDYLALSASVVSIVVAAALGVRLVSRGTNQGHPPGSTQRPA